MSGIKGFPSQQKRIQGQATKADFVTIQPTADYRNAADVHSRYAFRVGSAIVPRVAGATTGNANDPYGTWIDDTSTIAQAGDFVRFLDGNMAFLEIGIVEVSTNGFRLAARVDSAVEPSSGDSFYIMRYVTQLVDSNGSPSVSVSTSQIGTPRDKASLDIFSSNISAAAYTQLVASMVNTAEEIEMSNSSGVPIIVAFGAPGSEVDKFYLPSGKIDRQQLSIAPGTRISLKSVKGTISDGFVTFNSFSS